MKKVTRLICTILAIASLLSMAAFAGDYESEVKHYNDIDGHNFDVWSSLYTRSPNVAAAWICESSYTKLPVEYMSAQAFTYDENEKFIKSSVLTYNKVVDYFVVAAVEVSYTGKLYCIGETKIYPAGGGSVALECEPTATVQGGRSVGGHVLPDFEGVTEYSVTADGETYGSGLLSTVIGYKPDLISAVGDNGIDGYVRSREVTPEFNTAEEIEEYIKNSKASCTIPVYDLDGNIVDTFTMENITEYPPELEQKIAKLREAGAEKVKAEISNGNREYIPARGFPVGTGDPGPAVGDVHGYVNKLDTYGPKYWGGFFTAKSFPIPLYDIDGNIIGEFWVGGSSMFDSMSRKEIVAASNGHIK